MIKKVLNVGGNNKLIPIPAFFQGWDHILLDIDPSGNPDIVCDARELTSNLPGCAYDSIYCSHNLEHYYQHDVKKVLAGFHHVLKKEGFAYIRVPDIGSLMKMMVEEGLDIEDVLYQSPAGPITAHDVIYGLSVEIEQSSNDFYAHKTGFTRRSLDNYLQMAGFTHIFTGVGDLEVTAIAFKQAPDEYAAHLFNLPGA